MKIYKNLIAIPPGETIRDELEYLQMNQIELSLRMGMDKKTINQIINGIAPITYETAIKLENVLGIPATTWNNLESKYRETLARISEEEKQDEEWNVLIKFPYKEMIKRAWITDTKDKFELIKEAKKFFGVDSLSVIEKLEENLFKLYNGTDLQPLFRKTQDKEVCEYSMTAWLRKGELEASKVETKPFNKEKLKKSVETMKKLSKENSAENIEKLKKLCAENGIALVILPHLPKTYVDGVSRWLGKDKALIILSNRRKKVDSFWFNFFHELGHLLKHGKKELFINADETNGMKLESEANEYARNVLISKQEYKLIKNSVITEASIIEWGEKIGVHPSIIVGRLQYEKEVAYNKFSSLKENINL